MIGHVVDRVSTKEVQRMRGEVAETRREQIIAAARSLYEEKGIDRTSVKDIAERANITRSLFYHYFASRDEVTDAILDAYVESFVAAVREWNAQRVRGDVAGALKACVAMLRLHLFDADSFRTDLLKSQNALLYQRFSQQTARTLAKYLTSTTVAEYARFHRVEIRHPYEEFYLLIIGLMSYIRTHPDASDELVADLIADTLHLDLGPQQD